MGRWQRSYLLAQQSFAVLRGNPQLMIFPIVSAIATILIFISFMVPTFFLMGGTAAFNHTNHIPPMYYVVSFAFYLVSYFVVIFFNCGLVYCAHRNLTGQPATFRDGMRVAAEHIGAILGWTLIAATIGWVLRWISENSGLVGKIITGILGFAWTILTFFVVPLIIVENSSATKAVKESGALIKKTWGETLIMAGGMGLFVFCLSLVPVPLIIISAFTGSWIVILSMMILAVMYWLILSTIAASMSGIYSTALYLYARGGTGPTGFDQNMLTGAFQHKPTVIDKLSRWGR